MKTCFQVNQVLVSVDTGREHLTESQLIGELLRDHPQKEEVKALMRLWRSTSSSESSENTEGIRERVEKARTVPGGHFAKDIEL